MKNLLTKELRLTATILSYLFILFAVMTLIPGYPILVGAFFICLGIFYSFQLGRENNDILFTVLLPVEKSDAVRAKYLFTVFIQTAGFVLAFILTIIRMTALSAAPVYTTNPMMNANPAYLGWMLIVFTLFNTVFLGGFFKTAFNFGKPFVLFCIISFVWIAIVEALHHIPGLVWLNDTDALTDGRHWLILIVCLVIYVLVTWLSCKKSIKRFDEVDL